MTVIVNPLTGSRLVREQDRLAREITVHRVLAAVGKGLDRLHGPDIVIRTVDVPCCVTVKERLGTTVNHLFRAATIRIELEVMVGIECHDGIRCGQGVADTGVGRQSIE